MRRVRVEFPVFLRIKMHSGWFEQHELLVLEHFTVHIDYVGPKTIVVVNFIRDEDALAFSLRFGDEIGGQ